MVLDIYEQVLRTKHLTAKELKEAIDELTTQRRDYPGNVCILTVLRRIWDLKRAGNIDERTRADGKLEFKWKDIEPEFTEI